MKRISIFTIGCLLAILASAQHPVQLSFQRNGKVVGDFGLLAYYEVDSAFILARLLLNESQVILPQNSLPDSNLYFLIQVRKRLYPFHIDQTNITQSMRWEFHWRKGMAYRRWEKESGVDYDSHAVSWVVFHPLERGNGSIWVTRYASSKKALRQAKQIIHSFTRPFDP